MLFAHSEISKIISETADRQGWQIPDPAKSYMTAVLVSKIDKNPWQPQPSYAEAYLTTTKPQALIELADTCWFTRAVFPDMMSKRGLTASYFVDLGTSCYHRARLTIDNPALAQMEHYFEFLAEVAWTSVHSHGDFRSMWL
jgi:hypothetical protein